ncbi:BCCT family transporter [Bacillus sp. 1P06AnD]|uniref:BCCT family transporter n=1 Tax=Bacillus sp. 1P06AnD TaxID=3132208 RepID=UPI0039A06482
MIKKKHTVLLVSVSIIALFIIWGLLPGNIAGKFSLERTMSAGNSFLLEKFGWFYSLLMTSIVILAIYFSVSKYGKIRLGKDEDRPEFGYVTWLSMLFAAGMGIGLVFYGISEPIAHMDSPLTDGQSEADKMRFAMRYSFLNWGIHPWAIYAIAAMIIAYFTFRKGKSGTISSTVTPLFKTSSSSVIGRIVDILSVLAIVFGVIPTIGIGAQQIAGGLSYLIPSIHNTTGFQVILIGVFTVVFLLSAQTGIKRGIKYLSNFNIMLAALLLFFVLFAGPTLFILDFFTTSLGKYIQTLPEMSLKLNPLNHDESSYIRSWTIFYWGWWISWTPFVANFIARISKGRTIREFISGVVLVPALIGTFWFAVFGGTSLHLDMFSGGNIASEIASNGPEVGLFALLGQLPFAQITQALGVVLVAAFFITSADSATYVVAMQTSNGSLNPSNRLKLSWGIIISALSMILLGAGGLDALQTTALVGAFPFAFVIVLMIASFMREIKKEKID